MTTSNVTVLWTRITIRLW